MTFEELLARLGELIREAEAEKRASDAETLAVFKAKLTFGGTCAELFAIRRKLQDPKAVERETMNALLRSVGCYSAGSTRAE